MRGRPVNKEKKTTIEAFVEDPKITPPLDTIAPEDSWEEKRQKKVDLFYENSIFDPDKPRKPIEPPSWMQKMYPGMEFSNVPDHPQDIGRYVGPDKGWEPIPAPNFVDSQDGRVHLGDTIWCMRPVEVGEIVKQRDNYMRDLAHGLVKTPAQQKLEESVDRFNRRGRAPALRVGFETDTQILDDPSGVEGMMDKDARRGGPPEDRDEDYGQPPKKYFGGYGPSKIFNQGG